MADQIKTLKAARGRMKAKLSKFKTFLGYQDLELIDIEVRLEKVVPLWEEHDQIMSQIDDLLLKNADSELNANVEQEDEQVLFKQLYFDVVSDARKQIDKLKTKLNLGSVSTTPVPSLNNSEFNPSSGGKLPSINLPMYDGSFDKWFQFRDCFTSLIHSNNKIANVQKMHYLKSCVSGQAASAIESLQITNDNYDIAWKTLIDRFDNKKIIVNQHIKALLEMLPISRDSHSSLRNLLDTMSKHMRALQALKVPTENWDILIIHIASSKLDFATRKDWEDFKTNDDFPTLKEFTEFIKRKCEVLEALHVGKGHTNFKESQKISKSHLATNSNLKCKICSLSHFIYNCSKFKEMDVDQRIVEVKRLKLCINCLKSDHFIKECRSRSCTKCNRKHNSLLHKNFEESERQIVSNSGPTSDSASLTPSETVVTHCANNSFEHVLLSTVSVLVFDKNGKSHEIRALLDNGSQSNFITRDLSKQLSLPISKSNISVRGIGEATSNANYVTWVKLESCRNNYSASLKCFILDNITNRLPEFNLNIDKLEIPSKLTLADPTFYKSGKIDMLIGAQIFWKTLCVGQVKLGNDRPILQKTQFS